MLQRCCRLTCVRAPHHGGSIRGAAEQKAATGAEATAVNAVAMARQRRIRKFREVSCAINTESFIPGAGRQEGWGEGTAADLVCVVSKGAN